MDTPEAPRVPSPLGDLDFSSSIADVRRWVYRQTHPTWMHAAYADLAGRMERLEAQQEELTESMSLLHAKMEMLIGQLVVREEPGRVDLGEDEA